ncbi:MAG: ribosome biogenesis GTPase YlqF [Oscillospiraceae bacterium]|nr:ribosome biogenesis GTPase YlqF [Oscillospiraceae bacterium]MBR4691322.1 ribosome biogenesis GTPase YlqF [Oscillospiraceae bacterium]
MNVNWFPGHMTKALRSMESDLKLVDCVCELADARIPRASRNPALDALLERKPRLLILNRADQAEPAATKRWAEHYRSQGLAVLETDCRSGRGVDRFPEAVRSLLQEKLEALEAKGQGTRPLRAMVTGIPNVGKSTFINKAAGRKAAAASDRPGVTRGRQWVSVSRGLELLDTPGVLWPKFDDPKTGELLAFTGAVKDQILDAEELASRLLSLLAEIAPQALSERYRLSETAGLPGWELLEAAARKRGFLISRGEPDTLRMANVLLDEFRAGKLGRLTLEVP